MFKYGFIKGWKRIKAIAYAISLRTESNRFKAMTSIITMHVRPVEDIKEELKFIGRVLGYSYVKKIKEHQLPELNEQLNNGPNNRESQIHSS
jgi:hypothetical protein